MINKKESLIPSNSGELNPWNSRELKSECCYAEVKKDFGRPDFIGDERDGCTFTFLCTECGKHCNVVNEDDFETEEQIQNGWTDEMIEEVEREKSFEEKYNQLADKEFDADDICRLLCRITTRCMIEENTDSADITKTFYGEGFKFTINLKADVWDGK